MKIGIHHRDNSFSERWIEYCKQNNVPFKIVNCYDSDIMEQLKDCDALMWHHRHSIFKDTLAARSILYSLEQAGVKVYPNFYTGWHFDNKVAQKYLLEAIEAPMVPSYIFYEKEKALEWAKSTSYPKVFKLKRGAGSANVRLVKSESQSIKLIKRAFGRGFSPSNPYGNLKERFRLFVNGKDTLRGVMNGVGRLFIHKEFSKMNGNEKGYAYFQEFIPNNKFDIRIVLIGNKAFGIKRLVRENDFRASGSGNVIFDKDEIDLSCVEVSFNLNKRLKAQSIAVDFIFDADNNPLIVELSYGFAVGPYDDCPGYWDENLQWHQGKFNPQVWMIENVINQI